MDILGFLLTSIRLMEHYDLRSCFLPDLSGLHVRIYQFRELLRQHLPTLSTHLQVLQVEPAYVSQWFLSFFAVTCPLPMLFRIYDVIFAEGASETIMRVALSLMRKNEEKILACTEFEDVMQLLLSRGLWDCYNYNADEFVNDFVSLTGIVTHESLQILEASYKESKTADAGTPSPDVGSAASRFLGRLWAGSNASTKSINLSPGLSAPSRPVSFLRRSPSKQSIASTLNSIEGGGVTESMLSTSTDATTISRDSQNTDGSSIRGQSANFVNAPKMNNKDKNLHNQIEDLLTALSEMQRDHAILATQLQREREEREDDRNAVRSLLDGLRKKTGLEVTSIDLVGDSTKPIKSATEYNEVADTSSEDSVPPEVTIHEAEDDAPDPNNLAQLLDIVEDRFSTAISNRRSSMLQTKSQLRDELARSKEHLIIQTSKTHEFIRRVSEQEQEINNLRDQVREGHTHIRNAHQERQRLEKQIHDLRSRKSAATTSDGNRDVHDSERSRGSGIGAGSSGLRELKLGRTNSNRSQKQVFAKRTSSLNTASASISGKENECAGMKEGVTVEYSGSTMAADNDALVLELVQAKTAEAIAKQEAEEAKGKLESLRKMLGMPNGELPNVMGHRVTPSQTLVEKGNAAVLGYMQVKTNSIASTPMSTASTNGGGGFWGGWGKRTVSTEKVG